jgi:hypothetical protein
MSPKRQDIEPRAPSDDGRPFFPGEREKRAMRQATNPKREPIVLPNGHVRMPRLDEGDWLASMLTRLEEEFPPMKLEKGNWRVTRRCCRSGNCFHCLGARTGKGSVRLVQGSDYSEAYARYIAHNWRSYEAIAEPMGGQEGVLLKNVDGTMEEIPMGMSNCDGRIDPGLDKALRARPGQVYGRHAGWNFNGLVWFESGLFHEQVWCNKVPQKELSARTLRQLMDAVNGEFGSA